MGRVGITADPGKTRMLVAVFSTEAIGKKGTSGRNTARKKKTNTECTSRMKEATDHQNGRARMVRKAGKAKRWPTPLWLRWNVFQYKNEGTATVRSL